MIEIFGGSAEFNFAGAGFFFSDAKTKSGAKYEYLNSTQASLVGFLGMFSIFPYFSLSFS